MTTLRIPTRFMPIYEEGRVAARIERGRITEERTSVIEALMRRRRERNRLAKILRTQRIAREWTAERKAKQAAR